jgi:alcohol dehydrogenase class IV
MRFDFATSDRILFGEGTLSEVGNIAADLGGKALIVTGSGSVPIKGLQSALEQSGVGIAVFRVEAEPDIPTVQAAIRLAKKAGCDLVIGYGGGSSLDTAKAVAAMVTNPGELLTYLEVIGEGKKIPHPGAPMIAIPTTAGTGTEVTRNAVISSPEHHVKVSVRSPLMIPTVALVDPECTYTMPPEVTASTGMDALTQVIEAYVSNRANPLTDAISREGILRGARALLKAYQDGSDRQARRQMALTSLCGGLALANGGLGAVHGFAGPMGGMFHAPHGAICAALLPYVMKYNVRVLAENGGFAGFTERYHDVARWLTGDPDATIQDGVRWIQSLAEDLHIPGLSAIGVRSEDFDRIIEKSQAASSMKKNPIELPEEALRKILEEAL